MSDIGNVIVSEIYIDDRQDMLLLVSNLNQLLKKIEGKEQRLLVYVSVEECNLLKIKRGGKRKK